MTGGFLKGVIYARRAYRYKLSADSA